MQLQAGLLLTATPALAGSYFENARIFISEYNSRGAIGFVVNKPFGRSINELEEFKQDSPVPLFAGGPMDTEHIYILHCRPDLITGGTKVAAGIYAAGNIRETMDAVNSNSINKDQLKLFIGYCGWDAGDLEAEVEEGSWEITAPLLTEIFQTQN